MLIKRKTYFFSFIENVFFINTTSLHCVLRLHKRYFIIDQQIARHFVQYTEAAKLLKLRITFWSVYS